MNIKPLPPEVISSMKETFRYEPETGHIIRLKADDYHRSHLIGKPCGCVSNTTGYVMMTHHKRTYLAHRVAFVLMTGEWPISYVDHINRCKTDNRWENLRLCSHAQSSTNISLPKNNHSGARGVYFYPGRNRWVSFLSVGGKRIWLGSFLTQQEAIAARIAGGERHHGEFAGELVKLTEANHG